MRYAIPLAAPRTDLLSDVDRAHVGDALDGTVSQPRVRDGGGGGAEVRSLWCGGHGSAAPFSSGSGIASASWSATRVTAVIVVRPPWFGPQVTS